MPSSRLGPSLLLLLSSSQFLQCVAAPVFAVLPAPLALPSCLPSEVGCELLYVWHLNPLGWSPDFTPILFDGLQSASWVPYRHAIFLHHLLGMRFGLSQGIVDVFLVSWIPLVLYPSSVLWHFYSFGCGFSPIREVILLASFCIQETHASATILGLRFQHCLFCPLIVFLMSWFHWFILADAHFWIVLLRPGFSISLPWLSALWSDL